ncbi:MAG TPA: LysR family transcriptional regulator [Candidatus Dormibacteraeota bacterium]|nr:LysR family transcriptional regulator [Candidatus Dormibacteraeota bacterium]
MNLHKLAIFCDVIESGTLTAAAEHFYVSQPVVSAHIRDLEREFGAKLLVRDGRRMVPTEAGRAVYDCAVDIQRVTTETKHLAAALQAGEAGGVTVGASHAPGDYLLPAVLAAFREGHPRVKVRLGITEPAEAYDRVLRGLYDFALVTSADVPSTLHAEMLGYEPLLLVAAPSHPLAAAHAIAPNALRGEQIIYPFFPSTQAWAESCLRQLGIPELLVSMELGSLEAMKRAAAAGMGIALLYRFCVEAELRAGALVALDVAGSLPAQPIVLVRLPQKRFAPVQARLLSFIRASTAVRREKG